MKTLILDSPLFTSWSSQLLRLHVPDVTPGAALELTIAGTAVPFQYTGAATSEGAEILVELGFSKGERKELCFTEVKEAITDLAHCELPLSACTTIGQPGAELQIGSHSPFQGFAGHAMSSRVHCETALEGAALTRVGDGPLFTDYTLTYRYAQARSYTLTFRCYKQQPWIEVSETFSLRLNACLSWTLNPNHQFTHIISRDNFEGESQPSVEPLGEEHPRDILCRLQMPVLSEYFIPNNRGWFAFHDQRDTSARMVGILGLYGARWEEPVANMPTLYDKDGTVEWQASLASGRRHWLLVAAPLETTYTPERRFLFHRLHAEFNSLRLDEHLDLAGKEAYDTDSAFKPAIFVGSDFRDQALKRVEALPMLRSFDPSKSDRDDRGMYLATYRALLEPTASHHEAVYDALISRFEKWVRQFQGWRVGEHDYAKNVIGFSRYLRGMLIAYELLRKDRALTDEQICRLGAYFSFAARRILDEGRWPHSRTWKHPDHPESSRDLYTYGGEHKPDRLVWTNSLPNFQSDPLCALAHLSAIFQEHPDAVHWREFGLAEMERQLDAYTGDSGAWEESINYALYSLLYFIVTFRAVKYRWGIDYFQDERVRRFVGWLCRFFGPHDKRFGCHTWPAIGNAILPQNQAFELLMYAAELPMEDPLRHDCLAIYQLTEHHLRINEQTTTILAAMAAIPDGDYALKPVASEAMDEVGVSMRHHHLQPDESYLFQKIGFAKDHYEGDESSFNWYAKGTPLCMDYGTYTGDIAVAAAHNLVEIPDEDSLRRGYLADHLFTPLVDYTHCEIPVTLKLLWGHVRTFEEVENKDGKIDRTKTPYFYIGDPNPVGPKTWKVRKLFYIKPDFVVIFDRVYGQVPHRYNLHVTGDQIERQGQTIRATGRFDLDLLAYVQHPSEFRLETGETIPNFHPAGKPADEALKHAQHHVRLYNEEDGIYRTVLFARERERDVQISSLGQHGVKVESLAYTDYIFLHDEEICVNLPEVQFRGQAGWIRQQTDGTIRACVPAGCELQGFGHHFDGRGPWHYNLDDDSQLSVTGSPPRHVRHTTL